MSAEQRIHAILADFADELTKDACDRCEQCSPVAMCNFHSVLSMLAGDTTPTSLLSSRAAGPQTELTPADWVTIRRCVADYAGSECWAKRNEWMVEAKNLLPKIGVVAEAAGEGTDLRALVNQAYDETLRVFADIEGNVSPIAAAKQAADYMHEVLHAALARRPAPPPEAL